MARITDPKLRTDIKAILREHPDALADLTPRTRERRLYEVELPPGVLWLMAHPDLMHEIEVAARRARQRSQESEGSHSS